MLPSTPAKTRRQITDVSTSEPIVQPSGGGTEPDPAFAAEPAPAPASQSEPDGEKVPRSRRRRWIGRIAIGVVTLLVIGIISSSFVTLPYYAIAPGSARHVDDLVRVQNGQPFPHKGNVLFTTVSLYRVRPLDAIQSWFNHDIDVVSEKQILGDAKPTQLNQINLQEMTDSKQIAVAVALRRMGAKEIGDGTLVSQVVDNSPASGHIKAGDVITSIGSTPTPVSQDAVAAIRSHQPGDVITITVASPNAAARSETVTLGKNPDTGVTYLGVALGTKNDRFDLPYSVNIDSGQVGGPSAGLAFTLEVLDTLTPGELTGGQKVAVTGTIEQDGEVGEVGGVRQKTAAVIKAGAKYFLVPAKEADEARKRAGNKLQVIPVSTLEQALQALHQIGGDTTVLPPPPAGLQQ